jgi:hypothetical protein
LVMLGTDGGVPSGVGMTAAAGLGRGERAPDMVLASRDGTPTRYYAHAGGRPALLVFADQACVAGLDALAEGLGAIGDAHLTVHVVGPPVLAGHDLPFSLLQDPDGRAAAAYRTGGAPTAFLLDTNLRVRAALPLADGVRVAADVAELVAGVRVPGEPLRGLQDRLLPGVRPRVLQRPPRQPQPRDRAPSVRAHPQPQ